MGGFIEAHLVPVLFVGAFVVLFSGAVGAMLTRVGMRTMILALAILGISFVLVVPLIPLLVCAAVGVPVGYVVHRRVRQRYAEASEPPLGAGR
ncbi:hypothetical protein [Actinoalloteichus spitiensis]|uniref:hypothetical protein n=1 Tax=Actinoalloteichus spitiensis TaxID=252394 RepID=UPI000360EE20|nr:hypothetical protein [Actinoalloteichus spitiensis]